MRKQKGSKLIFDKDKTPKHLSPNIYILCKRETLAQLVPHWDSSSQEILLHIGIGEFEHLSEAICSF